MPVSSPPTKTETKNALPTPDSDLILPDEVRLKLQSLGISTDVQSDAIESESNAGNSQLQVQADLDAQGRWGDRYLVATRDRLLVLSTPGVGTQNNRAREASPFVAPNGLSSNGSVSVSVDLDVPLADLIAVESKTLVGAASLEARLRAPQNGATTNGTTTNGVSPNGSSKNGTTTNGVSPNGSSKNGAFAAGWTPDAQGNDLAPNSISPNGVANGASPNGASPNGIAPNGAALDEVAPLSTHVGAERVVELLRSSNARSRELTNAARQLNKLREGEALQADLEEDAKWKRQTCPSCGRALPQDSTVCPFCVNKLQALKRLFSYLAPYKWIAVGNGLLSVLGIMLSFVPILLVQPLVDGVFKSNKGTDVRTAGAGEYKQLAWLVGAILFSAFLSSVVNIARGRSVAYLGARVIHDIRTQVYEQLQRLSLAYYDKREVGAVMSRVQNDVGMLQNFLLDAAENVILAFLTISCVVFIMLSKSPTLAFLVLLPVPFVVIGTNRYWRGLMKLWRRVWHQNSSLGARLADTLNGVRVVRAFAQEDREVDRFLSKSGELRDATMRVEQKAAIFYPTLGFIMGLGVPITWYFGGRQVLAGTLTFGVLSVFILLLNRLYEPIQQLTRLVNFTTRAMTAAERVFEILDTTPEVRQSNLAVSMPSVEGRVEFRDVTFGYDKHRPVLHGVNLQVEPGEMIGLVGHSGAGKSTLINLLMRFYDVDEGGLFVDGVDLREIDRDDLRSQIGVVLQEPYLFHGSVFSNIAYGKPDASMGEVMAAAQAAYAHNFIVGFPDGYDTLVGERGTRLSGGERQRISIARAILHNPKILILDEATASVDTETEQQIQQALKNLIQGRTTFAIAHRLSTLRHADRLVVLDGGRIVEQGTHDELMSNHGQFHKLITAQRAMNEVLAVGG